jgi:hypothetical protein
MNETLIAFGAGAGSERITKFNAVGVAFNRERQVAVT